MRFGDDVFDFSTDNRVAIGQEVVLSYVSGSGFNFNNFTADSFPEPATIVMWLVVYRRRMRSSQRR
jgi:hypothetical protein